MTDSPLSPGILKAARAVLDIVEVAQSMSNGAAVVQPLKREYPPTAPQETAAPRQRVKAIALSEKEVHLLRKCIAHSPYSTDETDALYTRLEKLFE